MSEKPTIFYSLDKPDYPDNPESSGYQHGEITVFLSIGVPPSVSNGLFRLTYQRGYDKNTNGMSYWYGETMETIDTPNAEKLKTISDIFRKMENYLDKLKKSGLTLSVNRQDDLNWRVELLKKIGAFPVEWSQANRAYTSYEYALKTKNASICIG